MGCGPAFSLHPLYNEEDVIFNPSLVGSWGEENDGWNFQKAKGNVYSVTFLLKWGDKEECFVCMSFVQEGGDDHWAALYQKTSDSSLA